jgi:hypothetical protein
MKTLRFALIAVAVMSSAQIAATAGDDADSQSSAATNQNLSWPREFEDNGTKLAIYQPQIEKWDGPDFASRAAVAITPPGAKAPVYGVVWFKARADIDKTARIVTLNNVQVTKVSFPTTSNQEADYLALIRKHWPAKTRTIALDHLEASFAISQAVKKARAVAVKNEPPRIIYSATPAVLVLVDGPPVLRPAFDTGVEQVINTRALIVKMNNNFYLTAANYWYEAPALEGPWKPMSVVGSELSAIEQAVVEAGQVDLMRSEEGAAASGQSPAIYVSTVPSELIQTMGSPQFLPVEGTQLLQVLNSDNAIFMDVGSNDYYVLISGRWFKAKALTGQWVFVPYKSLPADFAKIPPDHPKANVLVSVPGTPEAKEAVIANSIPQTGTINRHEAAPTVTYDGEPQFRGIEGTPLYYAVNSPMPVIRVDAHTFYSVQNGVWFVAPSADGPWVVATTVPPVIYSIPPSSPLYYVTFVRVYGSTPDEVYVGYTPGYFGTVVCPDDVVVYGTGWYYPAYCGTYWIGEPCTYGFGAGFACGYDTAFDFGFIGGWCEPWWGPYRWRHHRDFRLTGVSVNRVNIYRQTYPTRRFTPYSTRAVVAQPSPQRAPLVHAAPTIIRGTPNRALPVVERNNVYGGRDGAVYRSVPSGGWERNEGSQWRSVPQNRASQFNSEAYGRSLGEQRFNDSRSYGGGSARPEAGGSGRR